MAFDLSAAGDGTKRTLGAADFTYDATNGRWDRVSSTGLSADITVDYDGKADGNNYIASQYITSSVTWNQAISSFSTSNISFTFGSGTIYNNTVTQDITNPNKYMFRFQFTGAVGQFAIPAASVTTLGGVTNPLIYSPAIAGVYKPYPVITFVSKTSTVPVYSIADVFFPGVTRYFSTNIGTAAANAARVKVAFQNFLSVATTSFIVSDISRSTIAGTPTTTLAGPYNAATGTTASVATDAIRYADVYYSSISSSAITRFSIAAASYADGGSSNDASIPVYFASLPTTTTTVATTVGTIKATGAQVSGIKVTFTAFLALLQNNTLPSISGITRNSGTGTGTLSNIRVDTTSAAGNILAIDYTPAASPLDYSETFTIPAGWATFNGTTNVVKDPTSAVAAFATRMNATTATATINIVRSPLAVTTNPINSATNVGTTTVVLTFSRPSSSYSVGALTAVIGKKYRIYSGGRGGTLIADTAVPAASGLTSSVEIPSPTGLTNYYVEFDAGAYVDDYGNLSPAVSTDFTTAVAPVGDAVYTTGGTFTFTVPALTSSISVVAVGRGADGAINYTGGCNAYYYAGGASGGGGGGLSYKNNIPVTPGETLTVVVNNNVSPAYTAIKRGTTFLTIANGATYSTGGQGGVTITAVGNGGPTITGVTHTGGGSGGSGSNATTPNGGHGGAGAAGYAGNGGLGGNAASDPKSGTDGAGGAGGGGAGGAGGAGGSGGGVGLYGLGSNGSAATSDGNDGTAGSGGVGQLYGGGGGGGYVDPNLTPYSNKLGGTGALRIVYGANRAFPSTNVSTSTT